jgi:hypothetical protein
VRKGQLLRGVFAECVNTFRRWIHLRTGERAKSGPQRFAITGEYHPALFRQPATTQKVIQEYQMKKNCAVLLFFVLSVFCVSAQEPSKAAAELTSETPHFHGGDDVVFKMKLNEPLPQGAHIDVRFSPINVGQQFPASCNEPKDKDRKELLCNLKLADNARGGEWRIFVVLFFAERLMDQQHHRDGFEVPRRWA